VLSTIGRTVEAEDVRHFEQDTLHFGTRVRSARGP
jgi:hypothetical protein